MINSFNDTITIVIVLYKKELTDCLTYQTLINSTKNCKTDYRLILYNNSSDINVPFSKEYEAVNSEDNGKLFKAYNYALNYSIQTNCKWLLLLDQDTEITAEYIEKLDSFLNSNNDTNIAAAVPILKEGNKILSPKRTSSLGWWEYNIKHSGYQQEKTSAFNSLTLINTNVIQSIGGFSSEYPLDMLDHWYYHQISLLGKHVYVLDTIINHKLSLLNYEENISLNRHVDFLEAERKFVLNELGTLHYITYKIRLSLRLVKQFFLYKNKDYCRITLKSLFKSKQSNIII